YRGLAPSALVLGAALSAEGAPGPVPASLIDGTVQAAMQIVARTAAGGVPAAVMALTEGVLRTMFLTKLKVTAATLLAIGTVMAGAGVLARQEGAAVVQAGGVPGAPAVPETVAPVDMPETLDRLARDLSASVDQFLRQVRATRAVLARETDPAYQKLGLLLRRKLKQVEAEVSRTQDFVVGMLGPDPDRDNPPRIVSHAPRRAH